jgi:molybdopterin-guanine dinucleotide biosynthesis protein A
MIQKKNITAIILAGGKNSRMGSDKGLLKLDGITFISRIIMAVRPLVNDLLLISSNMEYDDFGIKRQPDLIKDSGPMGGLFTGLFYSESPWNLVLSCDVPMINSAVIEYLLNASNSEADVNQLEVKRETLPLVALYKKQCMHLCLEELKNGERRLRSLVSKLNTNTVKLAPKLEPFVRNINTPAELEALRNEFEH